MVRYKEQENNAHHVHQEYIWPNTLIAIIVEHAIKHLKWMKQLYH